MATCEVFFPLIPNVHVAPETCQCWSKFSNETIQVSQLRSENKNSIAWSKKWR